MLELLPVSIEEYYSDIFQTFSTTRVLFTSKEPIFEGKRKAYVIPGLQCENIISFINEYKDKEVFIRYGVHRELANKILSLACFVLDIDPARKDREITIEQLSHFCEILEEELNILPKYVVRSGKGWHLIFPIPKSVRYGRYFSVNGAKRKQSDTFLKVVKHVFKQFPSLLQDIRIDSSLSISAFRAPGTKGKYGQTVTPFKVRDWNWKHERGLIALLAAIQFYMVHKVYTIGALYGYKENVVRRGYARIDFDRKKTYGELTSEERRALTKGRRIVRQETSSNDSPSDVAETRTIHDVLSEEEKEEFFTDVMSALRTTSPGKRNNSLFWLLAYGSKFIPMEDIEAKEFDFYEALNQADHSFPLSEIRDVLRSVRRKEYVLPKRLGHLEMSEVAKRVIEKWRARLPNIGTYVPLKATPGVGRIRPAGIFHVAKILFDFKRIKKKGNHPYYRFIKKLSLLREKKSMPSELDEVIEAFMESDDGKDCVKEIFEETYPPFGEPNFEYKRLRRYYKRCLPNGSSTRHYMVYGRRPLSEIKAELNRLSKKIKKALPKEESDREQKKGDALYKTGGKPIVSPRVLTGGKIEDEVEVFDSDDCSGGFGDGVFKIPPSILESVNRELQNFLAEHEREGESMCPEHGECKIDSSNHLNCKGTSNDCPLGQKDSSVFCSKTEISVDSSQPCDSRYQSDTGKSVQSGNEKKPKKKRVSLSYLKKLLAHGFDVYMGSYRRIFGYALSYLGRDSEDFVVGCNEILNELLKIESPEEIKSKFGAESIEEFINETIRLFEVYNFPVSVNFIKFAIENKQTIDRLDILLHYLVLFSILEFYGKSATEGVKKKDIKNLTRTNLRFRFVNRVFDRTLRRLSMEFNSYELDLALGRTLESLGRILLEGYSIKRMMWDVQNKKKFTRFLQRNFGFIEKTDIIFEAVKNFIEREKFIEEYSRTGLFNMRPEGAYILTKLKLSHYRVERLENGRNRVTLLFKLIPAEFWEGPWKPLTVFQKISMSKEEQIAYKERMRQRYRDWLERKNQFFFPWEGKVISVTYEVERNFTRYPTLRLNEAGGTNPFFIRFKKIEDRPLKRIMPFIFKEGREFYALCDMSSEEVKIVGFIRFSKKLRTEIVYGGNIVFDRIQRVMSWNSPEKLMNDWNVIR